MAQSQQLTDSLVTITPNEVGAQVVITDLAEWTRSENVVEITRRAITDALKKKQDTDGTTQLDNFSNTIGGTGTTLTPGYLNAAVAIVRGNTTEISNEGLVCVVHPYSYNSLVDSLGFGIGLVGDATMRELGATAASGTLIAGMHPGVAGVPAEVLRKYTVGQISGMPVMSDSNIAIASSLAKGGVFTKRAVVYVELKGIRINPQRDESLRGTEINGVMCYAYGERTDTWGVELNAGAATPSN